MNHAFGPKDYDPYMTRNARAACGKPWESLRDDETMSSKLTVTCLWCAVTQPERVFKMSVRI